MPETNNNFFLQLLSLTVIIFTLPILLTSAEKPQVAQNASASATLSTPTPFEPFPYKIPKIPNDRSYRIMLVGDSIVGSLGENAPLLRQHLIELYLEHEFVNYNYGFGSTSIETLSQRLTQTTIYENQSFPPILSQGFDLIIIESFAYNPLSQEVQNEGIAKHINFLDESLRQIIEEKPKSVVAIMTPIAPSKKHFAEGVYDLSLLEREKWANERIAYIDAVISYAKEKQIPLINVYEKSLNINGEVNLNLINHDDFIHPSTEGIDLISKTISEFIYTNKIFPD
jgi:hypothetical protein